MGKISIQHPSLADISCALLITVDHFEAQTHLLTGKIKQIWGHSQEVLEGQVSFQLWRTSGTPEEVRYSGADPTRDFKFGEQTILVEGANGFETFLPTEWFQKKLEIIFNKKLVSEMVNALALEDLSAWMNDYDLGPFFSDLMIKRGKVTKAYVVNHELENETPELSLFFRDYLKRLPAIERLKLLQEILEKSDLEIEGQLNRIIQIARHEMGDASVDAWIMVVKSLNPKNAAHIPLIATQMKEVFKMENLKARPGLIGLARELWQDILLQNLEGELSEAFKGYWNSLSDSGKKSFAPTVVKSMSQVGIFYQAELFGILKNQMLKAHDPLYFDLLKPVWSDGRFFNDETSRAIYFAEDVDELAKKYPPFVSRARELRAAMNKFLKT